MSFEIGQKIRVDLTVVNLSGAPTNATVAVSLLKPNLSVAAAPTVVNDSTGSYHFDVTPDATPGPWLWTATASGAVESVQRGQFWVRDPAVNLLSLEEVKTHLNKTVNTDDDELRDWIEAGKWVLEREVGPILPRTLVETYSGPARKIHLRHGPVIGVTAVTETVGPGDTRTLSLEDGVTYTDNQYLLGTDNRTVMRRSNGWSSYWASGDDNIRVTYMVGRYPIPMNYKLALGELVSHLWRASQLASGGSRPNVNNPDVIPVGYAVPNRVRELLGRRRGPRLGG
jgi:hypothetical protein